VTTSTLLPSNPPPHPSPQPNVSALPSQVNAPVSYSAPPIPAPHQRKARSSTSTQSSTDRKSNPVLSSTSSSPTPTPSHLQSIQPVNVWESIKDSDGESILAKFYKNPEKYAFSFQVMAFVTRLSLLRKLIKENPECKLIICERSLEADRKIFAKMLYDDKMIDEINYKIYMKFYNEYKNDFKLNGLVYIHAEEDVCYNRVHKRNRKGEDSVPLEYLKKCKEYHQDWLVNKNNILVGKSIQ
jgi:deoxyadenosine/deoxycytidine kinase